TLPNGLTVILSERPSLPIVSAALIVRTGGDANPPDRSGLADFTAAMLDEGTASRTALTLADDVAQLGASLTTGASMDATYIQVRSLKKNATAALDLLGDVALQPNFPEAEVDRLRGRRLTAVLQQREDPSTVADAAMDGALYGVSHPYGRLDLGIDP